MKNAISSVIGMSLCIGCTNVSEMDSPLNTDQIEYIDYSKLPVQKLTESDKILLKSIDFVEGRLVNTLSKDSAVAKGIKERRYQYFEEFLENWNKEIAGYIKDGATISFGSKLFDANGEVFEVNKVKESRGAQGDFEMFTMDVQLAPITTPQPIYFTGYYRLYISSEKGDGSYSSWTIRLTEEEKGLYYVLVGVASNGTSVNVITSADPYESVDWWWIAEVTDAYPPTLNGKPLKLRIASSKGVSWPSENYGPVLPDPVKVIFDDHWGGISIFIRKPEGWPNIENIPENLKFYNSYFYEVLDKPSSRIISSGWFDIYNPAKAYAQNSEFVIICLYELLHDENGYVKGRPIAYQEFKIPRQRY